MFFALHLRFNSAKWNAVESIAAFGWSGSAVLGGLLVDNYGFGVSFGATAFIQMMAWFPLILLLPLVVKVRDY